jgi:hypothetical protein
MLSLICGLAGIACCVGVWNAVDRADGIKVAMFGAAALVFFVICIFGGTYRAPPGCYTDWDGRANSEVCD